MTPDESWKPVRLRTGIVELDTVLGDGLHVPPVVLIDGEPGVGKSTLAMTVAAMFGSTCLYVATEMSARTMRSHAKLMELNLADVEIMQSRICDKILARMRTTPRKILILDSLNSLGDTRLQIDIVQNLARDARANNCALMILAHRMKRVSIRLQILHTVDAVVTLEKVSAIRMSCDEKNRFGYTPKSTVWFPK